MKTFLIIFLISFNINAFEYFQYGGLVTERDPTSENLNLFLAEYLTLGGSIGKDYFNSGMDSRRTSSGLYTRSPIHLNRTVSHDEITGWLITSKILGTNHGKEIWKQLKSHFGSYPAVIKDWTDFLPFNPSNYYAWCMLTECGDWGYLYLPIYMTNLAICANKEYENTSCKIIYWLELSNMPMSKWNDKLITYFDKKMTEMYGHEWLPQIIMLQIYHRGESNEFPIFKQINSIKSVP